MNSQPLASAGDRQAAQCPHGTAPQLQTMDPNNIRIMYKAEFDYYCCTQFLFGGCNFFNVPERKYLHVLENSYEFNIPVSCFGCCSMTDAVFKFYFDRGIYAQKGCAWKSGCLKGDPSLYANYSRCVCCCMECSDSVNQFLNCYYPSMCGDRVMVLTSETVCCCCPTRSCWLFNFCGLCGVKDGDPLPRFSYPFVFSLVPGTGVELAANMDNARNQWKQRLAGGMTSMPSGVSAIPTSEPPMAYELK